MLVVVVAWVSANQCVCAGKGNVGTRLVPVENTSLLETPILKKSVTFEAICEWFCCLFCKEMHLLHLKDMQEFHCDLKFWRKMNLDVTDQWSTHHSSSWGWGITFIKSLCSWVGRVFLWLIKTFSFTTEHSERTCWWWPKSCDFGCPCGQLAQEDPKGNETQLPTNHCCARSWWFFSCILAKCFIRYLGSS